MTDDRSKRRSGLLADSELIEGTETGSDPDVEVFDLGDNDQAPRPTPPTRPKKHPKKHKKRGWIEGVRTTVWEGREAGGEVPPALQPSRQVTGSIEVEGPSPVRPRRASPDPRRSAARPAQRSAAAMESRQTAPYAKSELQPEAGPPVPGVEEPELHGETGRYPRSRVEQSASTGDIDSAPLASEQQIVPVGPTGRKSRLRDVVEDFDGYDDYSDVEEEPPTAGPVPRLEAPSKIKVQTVDRISPDPRLRVITYPESAAAEQYRVLALRLKEGRAIRRVVAVMAPTPESAGPITVANLALALAEGRRSRILMLDADLRGGELAALFDIVQGPGLAEQIRNHRRQPEQPWLALALTRSLHFVPAGSAENPASLLNSEVLGDLMVELRRAYDFIIMATPPVIESADANILQEHVDGAVLVVRAGVTKKDAVAASVARLGGKKFLGTVLVGVKA